MIELEVDEILFELTVTGTAPFLGLGGEVVLEIEDIGLICAMEAPHLALVVSALQIEDSEILLQSETPDLNLYPAKLDISDSLVVLTSETPQLTLGQLPAGLSLVDNGDGTATISGTPAPGTAGEYRILLSATNTLDETERMFWLRIVNG